jgi:hypothetical protein
LTSLHCTLQKFVDITFTLGLVANCHDQQKPKVEPDFNIDLQAPALSINRVDPRFGSMPCVDWFSANLMLSSILEGDEEQRHPRYPSSQFFPPSLKLDAQFTDSFTPASIESSSDESFDHIVATASPDPGMLIEESDFLKMYTHLSDYDNV